MTLYAQNQYFSPFMPSFRQIAVIDTTTTIFPRLLKRPKDKYQFVRSQLRFFCNYRLFANSASQISETEREREENNKKECEKERERERIKENVKKNQRKKRKGEKEIGEQLHRATRKSRIHHDVNATLTRLTGG